MARQGLAESGAIRFCHDFFRLQYTENTGGFLSLGANIPEKARHLTFTVFVGVFLSGLLVFLVWSKEITTGRVITLALVLGGGFGNLIDRVCHAGRVIDFMNLGIGSLRTGVFNVADVAILVGAVGFFLLATKHTKDTTIKKMEIKKMVGHS